MLEATVDFWIGLLLLINDEKVLGSLEFTECEVILLLLVGLALQYCISFRKRAGYGKLIVNGAFTSTSYSLDEADISIVSYAIQAANYGKNIIRVISDGLLDIQSSIAVQGSDGAMEWNSTRH